MRNIFFILQAGYLRTVYSSNAEFAIVCVFTAFLTRKRLYQLQTLDSAGYQLTKTTTSSTGSRGRGRRGWGSHSPAASL